MSGMFSAIARFLGFGKREIEKPEDEEWPDDSPAQTILREQLEYYFSDVNLENDTNFKEEIAKSDERYVSVGYILGCNRVKQMGSTDQDILQAAASSPYLEADFEARAIRSKRPFVSDPQRSSRTLRVSGFGPNVPQHAQLEFFESIFPGSVRRISLVRAHRRDTFQYSGTSIVELDSVDLAKRAVENGIEYGNGLMGVELLSEYQSKARQNTPNSAEKRTPRNSRRN
jgi:lupus La protein